MGLIDTPRDKHVKWLTYATAFDGLSYLGFSLFVYGLKIGYAWHDAGPIMGFPIIMNGYLNMILATYAACGVYLLRVAKDGVEEHQMLLSMNAWALQFTHGVMMCVNMLVLPGTFAERATDNYVIGGIPGNFLPFGDVPFLFLLWGLNVFLMKKVFGTYW